MAVAIIAIGIPGSGKTSLLKPFAKRHNFAYINKDDIRKELTGDAANQSRNADVWQEANRRTKEALESGTGVVIDATFVETSKRRQTIALARACGATRVIGVFVDVPPEVAKDRNRRRDRTVPDRVVDWMVSLLRSQPPSLADGFDILLGAEEIRRLDRLVTPSE